MEKLTPAEQELLLTILNDTREFLLGEEGAKSTLKKLDRIILKVANNNK